MRLEEKVAELRQSGRGAFVPFLVIGDPDLDTSQALVDTLDPHADILEFGFAFTDPPADGPVIQAADRRALEAGVTVEDALAFIAAVRARTETPIALLIYYNLILSQGVDVFYARAKAAGVDAILVADVPVEEAGDVIAAAAAHDVAPIFIVSALTTETRLDAILQHARGYLYLVARIGVTGEQAAVDSELAGVVQRIRAKTDLPLLAGFGLSSPEHVRAVLAAGADGAISGSAVVRRIEENLGDPARMLDRISTFAAEMKRAT